MFTQFYEHITTTLAKIDLNSTNVCEPETVKQLTQLAKNHTSKRILTQALKTHFKNNDLTWVVHLSAIRKQDGIQMVITDGNVKDSLLTLTWNAHTWDVHRHDAQWEPFIPGILEFFNEIVEVSDWVKLSTYEFWRDMYAGPFGFLSNHRNETKIVGEILNVQHVLDIKPETAILWLSIYHQHPWGTPIGDLYEGVVLK